LGEQFITLSLRRDCDGGGGGSGGGGLGPAAAWKLGSFPSLFLPDLDAISDAVAGGVCVCIGSSPPTPTPRKWEDLFGCL